MRIGELSRRVGMSTHALRAWEKRYGLLRPTRSPGGYRLYSEHDEARVRRVLELKGQGVSPAQAVARVLVDERLSGDNGLALDGAIGHSPEVARHLVSFGEDLNQAVLRIDEAAGQSALDSLFHAVPVAEALEAGIVPYLQHLGAQWERGEVTIAHEHFASQLIRRRLSAFTLTWGTGTGPIAVLAAAPGERHDLVLLCFGVILGRQGWRVRYLGADTPVEDVATAARAVAADAVVVAATLPHHLGAASEGLQQLALDHRLFLAGTGAASSATSSGPLTSVPVLDSSLSGAARTLAAALP